jgi:hypothetical protein
MGEEELLARLRALFDPSVIAKCVLVLAGAYGLRALTENHLLPAGAGVTLGFIYAAFWIVARTTPLFVATGAAIAGGLAWEAATRFHFIGATGGSVLVAAAAFILLWRRHRRIAAVVTIVASIGIALGTSDAVPAALTVALVGCTVALREDWDPYFTTALAAASDSISITLLALTIFGKTPHDVLLVQAVMIGVAVLWTIAPSEPQSAIAIAINLGGAAALVPLRGGSAVLVIVAATAFTVFCFWRDQKVGGALSLVAAAVLASSGSLLALLWSLALASVLARFALITTLTIALMFTSMSFTDATSFKWTVLLTFAVAMTSLLASRFPEAAKVALALLVIAGLKILAYDLGHGQATTLVASLALYGTAMLMFAQRRRSNENQDPGNGELTGDPDDRRRG